MRIEQVEEIEETDIADGRAELINRATAASTLDAINEARGELHEWLIAHPGDQGIAELDEQLVRTASALAKQTPDSVGYMLDEKQ